MRFGIGMNTDHTLEEVGLQFSVTRERIRQIEAKALRKLKHPSRSKQLKSFLENNIMYFPDVKVFLKVKKSKNGYTICTHSMSSVG